VWGEGEGSGGLRDEAGAVEKEEEAAAAMRAEEADGIIVIDDDDEEEEEQERGKGQGPRVPVLSRAPREEVGLEGLDLPIVEPGTDLAAILGCVCRFLAAWCDVG
jgi:hypothetical protein